MPFEKGVSGNPSGRPRNARNKVNPELEVSKALASGQSLEEVVEWLSIKIFSQEESSEESKKEVMSEAQRSKYLAMFIDLKKFLLKEAQPSIKIKEASPKKKGEVREFPKAIFKQNSG